MIQQSEESSRCPFMDFQQTRSPKKQNLRSSVCLSLFIKQSPRIQPLATCKYLSYILKLVIYANRQRSAKHLWVYLNTNSRKTSDIEPFWWLVWATYTVIAYNASFSPLSSTKARNMPLSIFKRSLGLPSSTYTHYMSSNLTSICQFTTYDLPSI